MAARFTVQPAGTGVEAVRARLWSGAMARSGARSIDSSMSGPDVVAGRVPAIRGVWRPNMVCSPRHIRVSALGGWLGADTFPRSWMPWAVSFRVAEYGRGDHRTV